MLYFVNIFLLSFFLFLFNSFVGVVFFILVYLWFFFDGRVCIKNGFLKMDDFNLGLKAAHSFGLFVAVFTFSLLAAFFSIYDVFKLGWARACRVPDMLGDFYLFSYKCFYYTLDDFLFVSLFSLCLAISCFIFSYFKRRSNFSVNRIGLGSRAHWGLRKVLVFYACSVLAMFLLSRFGGYVFFLSAFNEGGVLDGRVSFIMLAQIVVYLFGFYGFLLSIISLSFWFAVRINKSAAAPD
tara:strand:+ start:238 stop:951 length:714 start_codon:yes stop_codon:yes gene_type:complete